MKCEDIHQAWREKLALNIIIWLICACVVFVIAIPGLAICPTVHVFGASGLASHSYSNSPNNVYTAICGEVFDLTQVAATHQRFVTVIPTKTIMQYGGVDLSLIRVGYMGYTPQEIWRVLDNSSVSTTTSLVYEVTDNHR
jgi:chitin synthase